ncbi:MAG: hypothetical protein ACE5GV_15210 [Candidatus Scalindua sp.]
MVQLKTIEIPEKAFSLLKAGWDLELRLLKSDINRFQGKVTQLEKTHGMDSKTFKDKFEKGELGDEEWCFNWANYLDILCELRGKNKAAESVVL